MDLKNVENLKSLYHEALKLEESRSILYDDRTLITPNDLKAQSERYLHQFENALQHSKTEIQELSTIDVKIVIEAFIEASFVIDPRILDCLYKRLDEHRTLL